MKRPRSMTSTIFGSIALCLGLLTTSPLFAQTTANGPYYATPSWEQTLPSATRFIVLSNFNGAVVLDRNTGLVWERSPGALEVWSNSRGICAGKNVGGQWGWRLPAFTELASLMDVNATSIPLLPPGHPFNVPASFFGQNFIFWSATTSVTDPQQAWAVFFSGGTGPSAIDKTVNAGV